ncbi:uncharacterized protein LOC125464714 isoform X2 [Stegostoma tigrinum]|nr:uncharacterized protein LOC125464714 isoform X2 [Stegostoma tigrinum]
MAHMKIRFNKLLLQTKKMNGVLKELQKGRIKIIAHFRDKEYSKIFLDYNTLKDVYDWLFEEICETGHFPNNFLLKHGSKEFPLKANTKDIPVGDIASPLEVQEQKRTNQQGGNESSSAVSLSKHVIRFDLPMDVRLLEGMSPTQYLCSHYRCDEVLTLLYKTAFIKQDKDRDGQIDIKEMERALLFVYKLHESHIQKLYDLININDDFKVDQKLFIALACLMSRILYKEPIKDAIKPDTIAKKDILEKADFYALNWRVSEVRIGTDLRILLSYLVQERTGGFNQKTQFC